jgi:hypothetical protein
MRLQTEVITQLALEYPKPGAIVTPDQVTHYHGIIANWAQSFPRVYALESPDTSKDETKSWVGFNRYYLHTIYYFFMLVPIRPYMAKEYHSKSPKNELDIRTNGIEYCLKNLRSDAIWVDHISRHGGGYYFMLFSLLDTVALLSATVTQDTRRTITNLAEIFHEVNNALKLLAGIHQSSAIATMAYHALSKVVASFPQPGPSAQQQKRARLGDADIVAVPSIEQGLQNTECSESSPDGQEQMMTPCTTPSSCQNVGRDRSTTANSPEGDQVLPDQHSIHETLANSDNAMSSRAVPKDHGNQFVEQDDTPISLDEFTAIWDWASLDCDANDINSIYKAHDS